MRHVPFAVWLAATVLRAPGVLTGQTRSNNSCGGATPLGTLNRVAPAVTHTIL